MMPPLEPEYDQDALTATAWRLQGPVDPTTYARFPTGMHQRNSCPARDLAAQSAARCHGRLSFQTLGSADRHGFARSAAPADESSAAAAPRVGGARNQSAAPSIVADDALCIAERKLTRHLQRNKLSMRIGLALGAAALATCLYSSQSFYRWAFLLAAAWELGILPLLCAAENRRLRRVLSLVQQELGDGVAAAAPGEA